MRSDPQKGDELKKDAVFEASNREAAEQLAGDYWGRDSLSGKERNRLFLNLGGRQFADLAFLSGMDHPGDGRSVVQFDYDRDGLPDIATISTNAPKLALFRNELGDGFPGIAGRGFVALRFEGGNRGDARGGGWSNRDGYGARVRIEAGGRTFIAEHRCGEGFSAQNSRTMLVGLGDAESIDRITVLWPSGREQESGPVPIGALVMVHENPADALGGEAFAISDYRANVALPAAAGASQPRETLNLSEADAVAGTQRGVPRLYVNFATWCANCRAELPTLARMRSHFAPDAFEMIGLPADADESAAVLAEYESATKPPYRVVPALGPEARGRVRHVLEARLGSRAENIPSSILVDGEGRVIRVDAGVPTLSDIVAALEGANARPSE